jgi:transposase
VSGRSLISPAIWGIEPESLRGQVRGAEIDAGKREGLTSNEREELRTLRWENFELRRSNEILKSAGLFLARELDPDRPK